MDNGGTGKGKLYSSFVIRHRSQGQDGKLEIAHTQSGARILANSMSEAVGWIQAQSIAPAPPLSRSLVRSPVPAVVEREPLQAKGGERVSLHTVLNAAVAIELVA